jgi:hypothetical protein
MSYWLVLSSTKWDRIAVIVDFASRLRAENGYLHSICSACWDRSLRPAVSFLMAPEAANPARKFC